MSIQQRGQKHRILVVEDENELREEIVAILRSDTVEVLEAADGEAALRILGSEKVDAVLSDLSMPRKSGLQLLHELRMQGMETPFVILTAYSDNENMLQALKLGATDFLNKPFKLRELRETMGKAAELGREIRRIEAEIDAVCERLGMTAEKRESFRRARLAVSIMGRDYEIYTRKRSA